MKNRSKILVPLTFGIFSSLSAYSNETTPDQNTSYDRIYVGYQALDDKYSEYNGIKIGYTNQIPNSGFLLGGEFSYNKSTNTYYDATLVDLNFNAGFDVVSLWSESEYKIVPYIKLGFGSYKEDYGNVDISDFGISRGLGIRYLGKDGLYLDASLQKQNVDVMNLTTVDIKWTGLSLGWSF
ncbi:hypothetical protein AB4389_13360 [Vibrio cyclitrophicus]